jgi:diadenosine tetraphosphate (Ap4A) HIT family hydrolase
MPLSPEEFYAQALASADAEGRMPQSRMAGWSTSPFELSDLRVVPLRPPELPEPPRNGERGESCRNCTEEMDGVVWENAEWRLALHGPASGAPLILLLFPKSHFDLRTLPDDLASEMGRLIVHTTRAIETLPHIARAHVARYGDGGAHLHVFFFARPEGFPQFRGTWFAVWDDLLPPVPEAIRKDDARAVGRAIEESYGGRAVAHE